MIAFFSFLLQIHVAFSQPHQHEHREHGAHVHGAAQIGIAFDSTNGEVDVKAASDSIIGFEHSAVTESDQKKQQMALEKFEKTIAEMIQFHSSLKCQWSKKQLEVTSLTAKDETDSKVHSQQKPQARVIKAKHKGEHSEVNGRFIVICQKSPVGTQITFNIQKYFPQLKDVDVQFLGGDVQKSIEANKVGTQLLLQ